MADGQWHTVRTHADKSHKQQKKKAQKADAAEEDDGPVMIDAPRVASANQWQAFDDIVEAKRRKAAENERRNKLNRELQKQQARSAEAAENNQPKAQAAAQLILFFNEPAHMTTWIEEAKAKYPDAAEGQLRLLTGHLEEPFEHVREKERGLQLSNPFTKLDVPFASIPRTSRLMLEELVENTPSADAVTVFWFLFEKLYKFKPTAEVSGLGIKIMLQCLARRVVHLPAILKSIPANVKNYIHNNKFVDRAACDLFLWTFGQVALADAPTALTVWYEYLLPMVLDGNDYATDALYYVDLLLTKQLGQLQSRPSDISPAVQAVGRMLAHLGSPSPNPRLQAIFPLLLKLSVHFNNSTPRAFFSTLLAQAGHKNAAFRPIVLEALFTSLALDSGCFEVWRNGLQYYTRFIPQSNNLVFHLYGAWDARPHKIDKKELARVLRAFISMNRQIIDKTYQNDPKHANLKFDDKEVRVTLASCQALLQRLEGNTTGTIITIGGVLLAAGAAYVWNTCLRHGCNAQFCYTILSQYCSK